MKREKEGRLCFDFEDAWQVAKLDAWTFYRSHFQGLQDTKAVDIGALDTQKQLWLIEVKDYRGRERQKPSELPQEVAHKVRDSLAMLAAARVNANDEEEKRFAGQAMRAELLRVVLHLELGETKRLRKLDPADILQKLKKLVRAIDPHLKVVDMASVRRRGCRWDVSDCD